MNPIASVIPAAVAHLIRPAPLSPGKVQFAWHAVAGVALERATTVRLENGVLIVEATTPQWAKEVRRSSPLIVRRLQEFLGDDVTRIEVRRK